MQMAKVKSRPRHQALSLEVKIAHLRDLDLTGLRIRWKSVFRKPPPLDLPRHLLLGVLTYRLQADDAGDLAADTVHLLKQLGEGRKVDAVQLTSEFAKRRDNLKTGTILVREWNGTSQRVMVMADGFVFKGKTYDSLSAIAFTITGTKWNGHRFFGLRDKLKSGAAGADSS